MTKCVQVDEGQQCLRNADGSGPGLGISIVGELNDDGDFEREFYFPYLESNIVGSTEECSVQRHTEKETYSGMVDENKVGITLIFYIQNFLEFREKCWIKSITQRSDPSAFPVCPSEERSFFRSKSQKQIQKAKVAAKDRSSLIEAAKERGRGSDGDADDRGY